MLGRCIYAGAGGQHALVVIRSALRQLTDYSLAEAVDVVGGFLCPAAEAERVAFEPLRGRWGRPGMTCIHERPACAQKGRRGDDCLGWAWVWIWLGRSDVMAWIWLDASKFESRGQRSRCCKAEQEQKAGLRCLPWWAGLPGSRPRSEGAPGSALMATQAHYNGNCRDSLVDFDDDVEQSQKEALIICCNCSLSPTTWLLGPSEPREPREPLSSRVLDLDWTRGPPINSRCILTSFRSPSSITLLVAARHEHRRAPYGGRPRRDARRRVSRSIHLQSGRCAWPIQRRRRRVVVVVVRSSQRRHNLPTQWPHRLPSLRWGPQLWASQHRRPPTECPRCQLLPHLLAK